MIDVSKTKGKAVSGLETIIDQLEHQQEAITRALSALRDMSITTEGHTSTKHTGTGKRRKMSAETRKRMAQAQQARWAAFRGEAATAAAPAKAQKKEAKPAKRKLSAQAIANIRAGVKRRQAAAKKQASATKKTATTKKRSAASAEAASAGQ
jgi:hypothetical protein